VNVHFFGVILQTVAEAVILEPMKKMMKFLGIVQNFFPL